MSADEVFGLLVMAWLGMVVMAVLAWERFRRRSLRAKCRRRMSGWGR